MLISTRPAAAQAGVGREKTVWLGPWRFCLLLGLFVLAAFPQVIFGLQTFVYRDFGLFGYPLAYYFRESVWRGELPLWNPLNECGLPFLAQWNTQIFYPPAWFYVLFPLSWALGVFCLAHLFVGGLGMYVLAHRWTKNQLAAAVAGVAFAFSGLMVNSLIWPNNIAALGLMPWVVMLVERAWLEGRRRVIAAALVGAMQMLTGAPEVIVLTWVLLAALGLVGAFRRGAALGRVLLRFSFVVLLICGLAAAQLLPFFDLLAHSHRDAGFATSAWSMPATGWANFLVPLFHCHPGSHGVFVQAGQYWTASYYLGVAVVALALCAVWRSGERRVFVLAGLSVLFLVLALGDAGFLHPWAREHFGVLGLMRFPIKFVVLPIFAAPLLAAYAIARLETAGDGSKKPLWAIWLVVIVLMLAIVWYAAKYPLPDDDWAATGRNALARAAFFTVVFTGLAFWRTISRPRLRGLFQVALLVLVWLDLLTHAPAHKTVSRGVFEPNLPRQPPPAKFGASRAMMSAVAHQELNFMHTKAPSADYIGRRLALVSNCNLLDDIPILDGFYSLHLPEQLDVGALLYARTNSSAPRFVEFLGVSQATSPTNFFEWEARRDYLPLVTGGQKPVFAEAGETLKRLASLDFDPRREVFLPPESKPFVTVTNGAQVTMLAPVLSAQQISLVVEANEPAMLVVAQSFYHDWKAYVDGRPTRLLRANHAFQALEVPAGRHQVKLVYEDRLFYAGAVVSLVTLAGCAAVWFRTRKSPGL